MKYCKVVFTCVISKILFLLSSAEYNECMQQWSGRAVPGNKIYWQIKMVHSRAELYLKFGPSAGAWYLFVFLKFFQGRAAHSFHCGMPIIFEALNKHDFNSEKWGQAKRKSEGRKTWGQLLHHKVHRMPLQVCFYFHGEVRKNRSLAPKLKPWLFNIFPWSDVNCTFSSPAFNTSDTRLQTKTAASSWCCHWSGVKKWEGGEIKTKKGENN